MNRIHLQILDFYAFNNITNIKMKQLLLVLLIVVGTFTSGSKSNMSINFSKSYSPDSRQSYNLDCSGSRGKVTYSVEGLPSGVTLDGGRIIVGAKAESGNYILRVKATDQNGEVAEKIVNLGIVLSSTTGTSGSSTSSGSLNGNSGSKGVNGNYGTSGNAGNNGATGTSGITISSTSTTSTSSSSVSSTSKLNQIITTYSAISDASTPTYSDNRYPEVNFPTGNTVPSVNPTVISIQNNQAKPSDDNRNQITVDDVKLRAASQRHQNAIKAITNLLTIIDQARANKDKAQTDITAYTNAYNDAVTSQRTVQASIYDIEVKVSQISSAINNINIEISKLNEQAEQTKTSYNSLTQKRTEYQAQIAPYNNQKSGLQSQITSINTQISQYSAQLTANKDSCLSLGQQIDDNKATLADLQQKSQTLDVTISSLTSLYNQKQAIVEDLQKRLNDAILDRDSTKAQLDQAVSSKNNLGPKIIDATNTINQVQISYDSCSRQSITIQQNIDGLTVQVNELNKQISDINVKITNIQQQVDTVVVRITEIESSTPSDGGKLADLQSQLVVLRQAFTTTQTERNKLYTDGNDANNRVAFAKQNLDAVLLRYQQESATVNEATLNLEKARSEQALARLAQEELIASYTNALPYAIVPNGNGKTDAGTPAGNNPSGSPLGPIAEDGGVDGQFTISSWTNYLSQAYGAGVNPAFSKSVTKLYSFSFSSVVKGNNVYNNIRDRGSSSSSACSKSGAASSLPSASTTGVVVAVRDNSFDLKQKDGSLVTINIAPCTSLNSNKKNYKIKSGDVAVVKGSKQSSKVYSGQSVTCLSEK